jgi:AraC-like DNA-binding protein
MAANNSRIRATPGIHETFGFASGLSLSPVMTRAHRHDDLEVLVPLHGAAVLDRAGAVHAIGADQYAVFWAGAPHRVREVGPVDPADPAASADVAVGWVTVPLVQAMGWRTLAPGFVRRLLAGEVLVVPAPATLEVSLQAWRHDIGTTPARTTAASREVEAQLIRASHAVPAAGSSPATPVEKGSQALATDLTSWISQHFTEQVTLERAAAAVHVHPSTASAAFRRHLGVTIGDYLAQCRTAEAQRLLISTDATIDDIARRAGFGSTSRLYARFAAEVGQSPGAYRRTMR